MQEAFIVSTARTPIGKFGGAFRDISPVDLCSYAMFGALQRAQLNGAYLDLYIFGNVLRAGHGQLLPRQAALKAGIPETVDGYAIDMVCASGMMSVINAHTTIVTENADMVLAGGFESMSQAGFTLSHRARWGYKTLSGAPEDLKDVMVYDGLWDPVAGLGMGDETERLAREYEVGRVALDEVAYLSQTRAAAAARSGTFKKEIIPVAVRTKAGQRLVGDDEGIRPDTTREGLAALRPAFGADGLLTAGNSSQISDAAAAVLLASRRALEEHNLAPIAKILGAAWAAGETWRFPEAPVPAVKKLLEKLNMAVADFDLFENNEAFALNNVLFHELLEVPYEKLNVNGGAIALGHPIGASGARLIVTLLNALEERGLRRGLAAICHGTGGSTALALERLT